MTRNLTRDEAATRSHLLTVTSYDISLDLTDGTGGPSDHSFRSRTVITFGCAEPGACTFVEIAATSLRTVLLNGEPIQDQVAEWSASRGLELPGLASENVLVVEADFAYAASSSGLYKALDPADGETYLYSDFEMAEAQRAFACFDQPDLKASFTWHVTVPAAWRVLTAMPVEREEPAGAGAKTVHFAVSPRMSTYVTALCAGPFHEVLDAYDGIDLGVYCRRSVADHLDAAEILAVTKQGFDLFQSRFGIRYPLPKYDQVFVPEYTYGAMENFGCVVVSESRYLFRSQATELDRARRARMILHELAHMWFGDLVTLRWWDDLWLNESFADWAAYWAMAEVTRFTDAWTIFLLDGKDLGYRQDQLSTTHPVRADAPDIRAAELNFDGITYAKGASILKQLVGYLGEEVFLSGLRTYFARHAWSNATFEDLLTALEQAADRDLREYAHAWLETSQINTISLHGSRTSGVVTVTQDLQPVRRPHRLGLGRYVLEPQGDGRRLVRRERSDFELVGEEVAVAVGGEADVLLLNDGDQGYVKVRLDGRSLGVLRGAEESGVWGFEGVLERALALSALWDMVRDGELATRDHIAETMDGLASETSLVLVTVTLDRLVEALTFYGDPDHTPYGWDLLADTAAQTVTDSAGGGGLQRIWVRALASAASVRSSSDHLRLLRRWLEGVGVPDGLVVDTELRWRLLSALVACGEAGSAEIDEELDRDRTAGGQEAAATLRALVPTAEAKAVAWQRLTGPEPLPSWLCRGIGDGFRHPAPAQIALTAPYAELFFTEVDGVRERQEPQTANAFAKRLYPELQVSEATLAATDRWSADPARPVSLRRLIAEGRDGVARALVARAADALAAEGPAHT